VKITNSQPLLSILAVFKVLTLLFTHSFMHPLIRRSLNSILPGYDAVSMDNRIPKFRCNVVPSFKGQ